MASPIPNWAKTPGRAGWSVLKKAFYFLAFLILIALFIHYQQVLIPDSGHSVEPSKPTKGEYTLVFPLDRFPETGKHIREAIEDGASPVCTIDRDEAAKHRKQSLKGVPTKRGYDRDEWPMAMCREGGAGADIAYIHPADNRGAGAWVSNRLEEYPDGAKVEFVVK
jgi:hypothetical protein